MDLLLSPDILKQENIIVLYLMIALGGSAGALSRFFVSVFINNWISFPFVTCLINVTGSFIMGFLFQLFQSVIVAEEIKVFLLIGFLGSYTTFSTYSIETVNLFLNHEYKSALVNVFASNILAVIMCLAGFTAAKYLLIVIRQGMVR